MKKFANRYGYSDIYPYEVVEVISSKTLVVRQMDSELDPNWNPIVTAGGFFGHCTNNDSQQWVMKSDVSNPTKRIRWSVAKNRWQDACGSRFILENMPKRKHDYNF